MVCLVAYFDYITNWKCDIGKQKEQKDQLAIKNKNLLNNTEGSAFLGIGRIN